MGSIFSRQKWKILSLHFNILCTWLPDQRVLVLGSLGWLLSARKNKSKNICLCRCLFFNRSTSKGNSSLVGDTTGEYGKRSFSWGSHIELCQRPEAISPTSKHETQWQRTLVSTLLKTRQLLDIAGFGRLTGGNSSYGKKNNAFFLEANLTPLFWLRELEGL